jgi:hypothetical protein
MVGDMSGHDDTDCSDMDDSARADVKKTEQIQSQQKDHKETKPVAAAAPSLPHVENSMPALELPVLLYEAIAFSSGSSAEAISISLLLSSASLVISVQAEEELRALCAKYEVRFSGLDAAFGAGVVKLTLPVGDRDALKLLRCASALTANNAETKSTVPVFCNMEIGAVSLSELANKGARLVSSYLTCALVTMCVSL